MLLKIFYQNMIVVVMTFSFLNCGSIFSGGSGGGSGGDTGWKVWVKTSPCSGGRADWISVARQNPTEGGGGAYFETADLIQSGMACTKTSDNSCTFAQATAVADQLRASPGFAGYCCRDYSVWQNSQSREFSVVKGMGTAGFGWTQVKSGMCCEEAEAMTGKTGLCGGTNTGGGGASGSSGGGGGGGRTGYIGCFKDTSAYDLDGFLQRSANNTPESCVAACRAKGFAFAAVQYGESCLCGNSYGKYGAADNCNYKCTGDSGKICGGYNANSVYGTGLAVPGGGGGGGGGTRRRDGGTNGDHGVWEDGGASEQREKVGETPLPPSAGAGRWTLDSVKVVPETPDQKMGWSYGGAQASSASMTSSNGDKFNFQWTKPPQQIDANGFTISGSAQCQSTSRCSGLMNIGGRGIESDTPRGQWDLYANGANGASGSGQKSITFKPSPNASELEVEIGLMWGAVRFTYKYRRV